MKYTPLFVLRLAHPHRWRARVRAALKRGGSVPRAAPLLGVTVQTLYRWLNEQPTLARGLKLAGPGRPRGRVRKVPLWRR